MFVNNCKSLLFFFFFENNYCSAEGWRSCAKSSGGWKFSEQSSKQLTSVDANGRQSTESRVCIKGNVAATVRRPSSVSGYGYGGGADASLLGPADGGRSTPRDPTVPSDTQNARYSPLPTRRSRRSVLADFNAPRSLFGTNFTIIIVVCLFIFFFFVPILVLFKSDDIRIVFWSLRRYHTR